MSALSLSRPAVTGGRTEPPGLLRTAVRGIVPGASAAAAALLITSGLALLIWAVTPAAAGGPVPLLRAGVLALAAGHGIDLRIGDTLLTVPPLTLGLVGAGLLWVALTKMPVRPLGVRHQALSAAAAALSYSVVLIVATLVVGSPSSVVLVSLAVPVALALGLAVLATLAAADDTRARLRDLLDPGVIVGIRLAVVGSIALIGGAAVVLAAGLMVSFGQAVDLATVGAGTGVGDNLGLWLLGVAFLPNAVIGAAGFATGAGVDVGTAHFGPFGSAPGDLPAVPLLAALPDSTTGSLGLAALALPVLVGGLVGYLSASRLAERRARLQAVGLAAGLIAVAGALAALLAAGGVTGGAWAEVGVSAWRFGLLLAAEVAAVAAIVAMIVPSVATDEPEQAEES